MIMVFKQFLIFYNLYIFPGSVWKTFRFNCLALGAVQTEMLKKAFPGYKAPLSAEKMD